MSAIWHDSGLPSFIGAGPRFSFFDVAEIVQPAPESYIEARAKLQHWERKFGVVWYQHNARLAYFMWQRNKPWCCSL